MHNIIGNLYFYNITVTSLVSNMISGSLAEHLYSIALIFRGSLISQMSRIWNRSRNLFNENLSHHAVTPMGNTNSRNLFNKFLQNSNSRKFRPAKYKRYTVVYTCSRIITFLYLFFRFREQNNYELPYLASSSL